MALLPPRDLFGEPIAVGKYVAYASLSGRAAKMTIARVLKLNEKDGAWTSVTVQPLGVGRRLYSLSYTERKSSIKNFHNMVVLPDHMFEDYTEQHKKALLSLAEDLAS